jgi:hypothetical protein
MAMRKNFRRISKNESFELLLQGRKLNASQVTQLEAKLVKDPTDLKSRLPLLKYYSPGHWKKQQFAEKLAANIIWMVDNAPEYAFLETVAFLGDKSLAGIVA